MALQKEHISFLSADGVSTTYGTIFTDDTVKPRGVMQVSHGMNEYIDRYEPFAEYFTARGFIVCGHDHLGHGRTLSTRGLGYFADKDGDLILVEDLHRMTDKMKERFPDLPYFLYGHSMGSFIAANYIVTYDETLTGVILSGTRGRSFEAQVGYVLASLLAFFQGGARKSKLLNKMIFGRYNDRYDEKRTEFDWLSRDTAVVDAYVSDEMTMFTFTNRGIKDIMRLIINMGRSRWALSIHETLPILLVAGDMDPVGHYGKGVKELSDRLQRSGVSDVTLKLYKGGRHEMHNETNREQVLGDILEWMLWKMKKKRK